VVINFRTHKINRDTHKLTQTPILIKKITILDVFLYIYFEGPNPVSKDFFLSNHIILVYS
jgi:hypothetical protein